jgi:hypothetical protein
MIYHLPSWKLLCWVICETVSRARCAGWLAGSPKTLLFFPSHPLATQCAPDYNDMETIRLTRESAQVLITSLLSRSLTLPSNVQKLIAWRIWCCSLMMVDTWLFPLTRSHSFCILLLLTWIWTLIYIHLYTICAMNSDDDDDRTQLITPIRIILISRELCCFYLIIIILS